MAFVISSALKEVFDFRGIDWKLWLLLFLSFFIPFLQGYSLFLSAAGSIVLYGIVPLFVIAVLFREPLRGYGLSLEKKRKIIVFAVVFSLLLAPAVFIANLVPQVHAFYSIPKTVSGLQGFLSFEALNGFLLIFWEFFFRGFILFGLFKRIGNAALPVHAIPFALFHIGKPDSEVIASFFAALLLGQIALKAKSFVPAFLIHWFIHAEMIFLANFS